MDVDHQRFTVIRCTIYTQIHSLAAGTEAKVLANMWADRRSAPGKQITDAYM